MPAPQPAHLSARARRLSCGLQMRLTPGAEEFTRRIVAGEEDSTFDLLIESPLLTSGLASVLSVRRTTPLSRRSGAGTLRLQPFHERRSVCRRQWAGGDRRRAEGAM